MHEYKRIYQRIGEGRENCPLEIFENISICPVLGKCEPRKLPTLPKNSVINLVVEYRTLKLEGLRSLIVPPLW